MSAVLRRVERVHYQLLAALYLSERQALPGATLFAAGELGDPEWNHAALLSCDDAALPARLAEIGAFYSRRERLATVAVSPYSTPRGLAARLSERGFRPGFRHTWMLHRAALPVAPGPAAAAAGVEIATVASAAAMAAFVEVFARAYASDPPAAAADGGAAPGYAAALWRSFHRRAAGPRAAEVVHYLARDGGRPVGVATALHGRGVSAFYNLAVLPEARRRGIAAALTARRLADAGARGARLRVLQSECAEVTARQRRLGFVPVFETVGYTGEATNSGAAARPRAAPATRK